MGVISVAEGVHSDSVSQMRAIFQRGVLQILSTAADIQIAPGTFHLSASQHRLLKVTAKRAAQTKSSALSMCH